MSTFEPEVVGTVIGSAIVVIGLSGRYVYSKVTESDREQRQTGCQIKVCNEHSHLLKSVDGITSSIGLLQEKVSDIATDAAFIKGMLERNK